MAEAGHKAGFDLVNLSLFPEAEGVLLDQDVIWVHGGSVVNLLAGISAGAVCWYTGGPTDSFGPPLRIVTDALGLLPYGSGVHYDSEPERRQMVHRLVAGGELPETHCTDDGAGLVHFGTELQEAVCERPGARG